VSVLGRRRRISWRRISWYRRYRRYRRYLR